MPITQYNLFDICVQDLYESKVSKDVKTFTAYVNDNELVANQLI